MRYEQVPQTGYFMPRLLAIIGISLIAGALIAGALIAGAFYVYRFDANGGGAGLEVKYRYLVVEAVGPAEWEKKHGFSIQWQGKDVQLPVVFCVPGRAENFEMGSGGEIFGHLKIGEERVPVAAKPDTKFQVRNTGIVAFIGERGSRKDAVAFSIATSVAMSPPEHPGELNPNATEGEAESSGKKLEKRVQELVAAGRVIEIVPGK